MPNIVNKIKKRKLRISLLVQVSVLFVLGIIVTSVLGLVIFNHLAYEKAVDQVETSANNIAQEVENALKESPSAEWLMTYCVENWKKMDVDYDSTYYGPSTTLEKTKLFMSRHPNTPISYLTSEEIEAFDEDDQNLLAEILYSRLITRMDAIKWSGKVDYLFCVSTDNSFLHQFFVFSAADLALGGPLGGVGTLPGRGTNYEDYYLLGTYVDVSNNINQQTTMREAAMGQTGSLSVSGKYMDYYYYIGSIKGHVFLIGLTYDSSDLTLAYHDYAHQYIQYFSFMEIFLALICLLMIYLHVLKPLKVVQSNIRIYKDTKDSWMVRRNLAGLHSRNEIGQLSEDLSSMTMEMDEYVNEMEVITAERQRNNTELSLASQIQSSMLPKVFPAFPDRKDFDIYASMDPAKEVGGDFYNFFLLDEDTLVMYIADVSGKGVPASLFMMSAQILLRNITHHAPSVARAMRALNDELSSNNTLEMFVTVWLGFMNLKTGIMTCANAGHEYPILKQPGTDFEIVKDKHGFVIGGMPGMQYKEYELKLEPGAKLFVYTDGLPEANNRKQQLFGMDRVLKALNYKKDSSPREILEDMTRTVTSYANGADQFDDLTMLCFQYNGPSEPETGAEEDTGSAAGEQIS